MVNGNWEEKRREEVYSNGRPERKSLTARRLGGGSRGNYSCPPPWDGSLSNWLTGSLDSRGKSAKGERRIVNVKRSVLKDRSREESACEKSVALIRRPAQDREQP